MAHFKNWTVILKAKMLPGDVLLVASFISYLGCFTKQYRLELFERKWLPFLKKLQKPIPLSLGTVKEQPFPASFSIFLSFHCSWQ